jgi:hypothetical protein
MLQGPLHLAVALVGLQQFSLCDYQPPVLRSTLELRSPPLDFALPPLKVVWLGMPLGEFVIGVIALSPLLLKLLPLLSL